jgi:hypothetical protein
MGRKTARKTRILPPVAAMQHLFAQLGGNQPIWWADGWSGVGGRPAPESAPAKKYLYTD